MDSSIEAPESRSTDIKWRAALPALAVLAVTAALAYIGESLPAARGGQAIGQAERYAMAATHAAADGNPNATMAALQRTGTFTAGERNTLILLSRLNQMNHDIEKGNYGSADALPARGSIQAIRTAQLSLDPVALATARGDTAGAEALLKAGWPANGPYGYSSALQIACARPDSTIASLLLVYGAAPDIPDRSRNSMTCLMLAALHGRADLVPLLLRYGANPHQKSDEMKTALDYAVRGKHPDIVRMLTAAATHPGTAGIRG